VKEVWEKGKLEGQDDPQERTRIKSKSSMLAMIKRRV
jgi:hypothetical protein